jgi:hypothetical protein
MYTVSQLVGWSVSWFIQSVGWSGGESVSQSIGYHRAQWTDVMSHF